LLLIGTAPAAARKHAVQVTLVPAISWIPAYYTYTLSSPTTSRAVLEAATTALGESFNPLGAGASLQLAYELATRDRWSALLWLQGGLVGNAIVVQPYQKPLQHALIAWNVLAGGTFRVNIDNLIFHERASRVGALFEAGIGLSGATVNSETQLPLHPRQYQAEIAPAGGTYNLGLHLGLGLDYWITRRLIIGLVATWDVPVPSAPFVKLLRVPDGSILYLSAGFGYLSVGPTLTLRL
jgi:hypothetical protein